MAVILAFLSSYSNSILIHALNWLVVVYFYLEAFFKIKEQTWLGYISTFGNKFDFSIVVISSIFLFLPSEALGSVIYLRIFRIISLVKIIRLMPNTEHIVNGLIRAIKASKAVLILLAVQLTFFSLLGFTLFSNVIPEYFGDPLRSMNTIFGIFTIENWGAVPEAAKELANPYAYYAVNTFVITVLILGGFIALSLANAIFVDEMASDNNDVLMEEIAELKTELSEIKELLRKK
ncbi:ion transporter [Vibrio sp. 10N.286.49.B3]|uniref:ion transporter n=1 Tax=Vibrio sp. 10N.286.49.B3 TaxID=1880855 RepID=UPI001F5316D0|nr:ion transporter [Vibrio sp. 10N.286.49.B3]